MESIYMGKRRITCIDIFCGAGGFSEGMTQGGLDVLCGIDNDIFCCSTYFANHGNKSTKWIGRLPDQKTIKRYYNGHFPPNLVHRDRKSLKAVICDDVTKLSGTYILKACGVKSVDVLVGGPPCQGFSLSNRRGRSIDDPRSKLMWEAIRLVGELQPKVFVIENVPGLLSFKDFAYEVMKSFEDKGYVVRVNMLDACSYGVPQYRKRIFIQGIRKDLKRVPKYAPPTHFDPELLKVRKDGIQPALVAQHAFAGNGFTKEELKDLWWNTRLHIYMNRKTAAARIEIAVMKVILSGMKARKGLY